MKRGERERWPTKAHWEHIAASMDPGVIGGTILAWQPLYKEPLTPADAAEIDDTTTRFIALMAEWKEEDRLKEELAGLPPAGAPKPSKGRRSKRPPPTKT